MTSRTLEVGLVWVREGVITFVAQCDRSEGSFLGDFLGLNF